MHRRYTERIPSDTLDDFANVAIGVSPLVLGTRPIRPNRVAVAKPADTDFDETPPTERHQSEIIVNLV